ncbi:MAG: DUF945 family protein, partial [Gammaproteobacteria bacterium]|nr:DUF945 family protein [Gammaproteobacteria bacterium]
MIAMHRRKQFLAGFFIILALALLIPLFFGRVAYQSLRQGTEQFLTYSGWQISSEIRKRGWLKSELAHLISPIEKTDARSIYETTPPATEPEIAFIVQHKISHGPFPGLLSNTTKLGMASIESTVSLSQNNIDQSIPAVINTKVSTPSVAQIGVDLTAGAFELEQQALRWGNGRLSLNLDQHGKVNYQWQLDSFENETPTFRALIGPTRANGELTLLGSSLWLGDGQLTSDGVLFVDADRSLRTDDIQAKISGVRSGDQHIDYSLEADYAQEDLIGGFYGKNKLAVALNHVSQSAITDLDRLSKESSPNLGKLLAAIDLFISEQPELVVDVDMVSNHGPIRINGVASLSAGEQQASLFSLTDNLIAIFDVETTQHWLDQYDILSLPEINSLVASDAIAPDDQGIYRLRGKYIG